MPQADEIRARPSISVILPAYNEEAVIERSVRHVADVLRGLADDYEIVVTDDGSRDRTGEVLASLANEQKLHLRVVTHEHNRVFHSEAHRPSSILLASRVSSSADGDVGRRYRRAHAHERVLAIRDPETNSHCARC